MCGIAGIITQRQGADNLLRIKNAAATLHHRGPESNGAWQNEKSTTAFAHQRLSIIDLSRCGAQPMHYAGRYTIIHNGELYNYKEIKKTLESKGHHFTST